MERHIRPYSHEELKNELSRIIERAFIKLTYEGSKIYFLEELEYLKILNLRESSKLLNNSLTSYQKTNDPFFSFGKILNSNEPIIAYKTFLKHKYVNITDPEKVKDRIEKEYEIVKNETVQFYRELKAENDGIFDSKKLESLKIEESGKLEYLINKKKFLLEHFNYLDIRITTFKDNKIYPHIKMIDIEGNESIEFLRDEVPNILYAHKNIFILKPGYRKDAKHIKFVLEAEHAFGEIYFRFKEDKE